MSDKIKVGITQGDLNGIGLEVIIKTFFDPTMLEVCTPVLFGSQKTFSFHRKMLNVDMRFTQLRSAELAVPRQFNIVNVYEDEINVEFGKATDLSGKLAVKCIEAACEALEQKKIDVLVTAPVNKHNIQSEHFQFKGHTDYLEARFKGNALMLMCSDNLRVGVVTGHVPLVNVSALLNQDKIVQKIKMLSKSLTEDFAIRKPKIAVLGLNPHAGDNGTLGGEEQAVIVPAIAKAKAEGATVFGPYSADGFFGSGMHHKFDAVLAMYHDQGLVPFKALAFDTGVNYTAGLPIVRTSPGHGVGYDIAGQNKASENSFRSAVYLACDVFMTRKGEKALYANTLKAYSRERE
jgi:4-hydroxythreonine-4-phosphate dehydrogenase